MANSERIYEVEIKSQALLREGMKSFITYFMGGRKKTIVSNVQKLYPQFTAAEDKPIVLITPISKKEYEFRKGGGQIQHKRHLIKKDANITQEEDYETVGN